MCYTLGKKQGLLKNSLIIWNKVVSLCFPFRGGTPQCTFQFQTSKCISSFTLTLLQLVYLDEWYLQSLLLDVSLDEIYNPSNSLNNSYNVPFLVNHWLVTQSEIVSCKFLCRDTATFHTQPGRAPHYGLLFHLELISRRPRKKATCLGYAWEIFRFRI